MICPRCNTTLAVSVTNGIEIDYCPTCRGVWLDKGELEKIIERSDSYSPHMGNREYQNYNEHHSDNHHDKHYSFGHQNKHKKGFFSELFDF